MPPIGLRLRLIIPLACLLIAYGGFYAYLAATTQRDEILAEARQSTLRLVNTIRRSTRYAMLHSRREDVHQIIKDIGEQPGIEHVRILNKEGSIMFSSAEDEIHQVVDRKAEACYQCHAADEPLTRLATSERSRIFQTKGHRALAAIEVIYNERSCWTADCHAHSQKQNLLGVIDVGVSLAEADQRVARTTRNAILIGLISSIAICGLVGLLVHRLVNRPVQQLLECTRRVGRGDLNCTLLATSDDELGHLARSFRQMTVDLGKAQQELNNWAQKLEKEVEVKTRDLMLAQAQVVRSEKLSSIGMLAAGVAHELNSPLTGILTFAHLLAKKFPDGSREKEHLQVIAHQAERCAKIIRQLLDFSREQPSERKAGDVRRVLEQAIALVEHQSRFHDIVIQREFAGDAPATLMNLGEMQQVFLNLLVNAAEAMPAGGSLTIHTRNAAGTGGGGQADFVEIEFRDTGVGIAPQNLDKIFDPFYTSKEVGKGTGLGLSVTYGIIERHVGTIEVESELGKGTAFTIRLPAHHARDEPAYHEVRTSEEC